ncbi:diguanylate cyclase [Sulfitobacter sp. F26169L]|uniref:diguanylate cyclase n=1 Tax=Sulfitobacter sp. F26169L TaxID=2996015 RepID=UPI002260DC28|nr:diguanylate cyclase [Sulfitobacter sp. F26169L]MCX7566466.1 diguanylate cyclase [Sulfitobacter sp. F26169L]
MQGKILIIDGISTNRIVLKVKLAAAFYHVLQADTLVGALEVIHAEKPDLVITALHLPDGTASDLCAALRKTRHAFSLPVLAIGGSKDTGMRLETLSAGAFEVMHRPINETLLLGRVRNMIRAHHKFSQWQIHDDTSCALGLAEEPAVFERPENICLIGLDAAPLQGWVRQLQTHLRARYNVTNLRDAMAGLHGGVPRDAVVIALPDSPDQSEKCLRLIPALRASAQTQDIALLVIQKTPNPFLATSALDMGADDVMASGFDAPEVALRLKVLLQRKRQVAQMLQSVRAGLREAINDPLTGLYNRRHAMPYLKQLIEHSTATATPYAVILADMDFFKRINDAYGHASGDAVLVETARRLRDAVRDTDIIARMGGEEFLIAMPATDIATAQTVANHLCRTIGESPFDIPGARHSVSITISIGLTVGALRDEIGRRTLDSVDALLDRADKALYAAKLQGRNRVTLSQPQTRPAA